MVDDSGNIALTKYKGEKLSVTVPAVLTVGDSTYRIVELSSGLFTDTEVTSVELAADLKTVDPAAFDGSKIASVSVSADNAAFMADGKGAALVSADGETLWRVMPEAAGNVQLGSVSYVASGALKDCKVSVITLDSLQGIADNAFTDWSGTVNLKSATPLLLGSNCFGEDVTVAVKTGHKAKLLTLSGYNAYEPHIYETSSLSGGTDWDYRVERGNAILVSLDSAIGVVNIPAAVDGYPVIDLDPAFDASNITSFTAEEGSNFTVDENGVLFTADMLRLVRFPAACELTDYVVPEQSAVADRAFADAANLKLIRMYLYSMRNLGALAFENTSDQLVLAAGMDEETILRTLLQDGVDTETLRKLGLVDEEEKDPGDTPDDDGNDPGEEPELPDIDEEVDLGPLDDLIEDAGDAPVDAPIDAPAEASTEAPAPVEVAPVEAVIE